MSFMMDPLLLLGMGIAGAVLSAKRLHKNFWFIYIFSALVLALFYGISVSLYVNMDFVRPMWEMMGAKSGLDWMLNSGVLHLNYSWPITDPKILGASILLFCTYPFWLYLGVFLGYMLFGRNPRQTGVIGIFKLQ